MTKFRTLVVAAFLGGLPVLQSCSSEAPDQPAPEFRFTIPAPAALTLDEINELKKSLCDPSGNPPVHTLSAAVFDDYSAEPHVNDAAWKDFIDVYGAVRQSAVDCGWTVLIEGFTQSSAPVGSADSELSQKRADATRHALIELGYAAKDVRAVGRGVGGSSAGDRRVDIKFVRR